MKKTLILAVVAAILAAMILPCTVSAAVDIPTPNTGKVNVLLNEAGMLDSPNTMMYFEIKLTDGIVAQNIGGSTEYLNKAWTNNKTQGEASKTPTFPFKMTDGSEKVYIYTITFSDLYCDIESFSLYFANHTEYTDGTNGFWQMDSQWAMLVSCDDGETWTEAYRSPDPHVSSYDFGEKKGFIVDNGGARLVEEGGVFSEEKGTVKDGDVDTNYWYRYVTADFDKKYEKVTNVAYACICPRMNFTRIDETKPDQEIGMLDASTGLPTDDPFLGSFYYVARISEIEVYGNKLEKPAETEPAATEPVATEPVATEPVATEPVATEPVATDPVATEPAATDPVTTDKPADEPKSGCGSAVGIGVAVILTVGCAVLRKKH